MATRKPVIVICGGAAALAVIRSLGAKGIPIVAVSMDDEEFAHQSKFVTHRWRAPHPEKKQPEFIDFLLDHSPKWRGSLLIPCSDNALSAVSRNKRILESYFSVACPDWELTKIFLEKKHTRELARIAGVPCPWTYSLRTESDLEELRTRINFPCLVKPSTSHQYHAVFRAKMKCVQNFDEARRAFTEAAARGLDMMLQEYIPGNDDCGANYNSYWWEGAPLVEFTARKVRNSPQFFGSPRVVRSEYIGEAVEQGRKLLRAAQFSGYACTEFKRDPRDGIFKLMEVNVRHNLSSQLAIRCGIDFPYLQYQHLVEGRTPTAHTFETGVYWIEMVRDIGRSFRCFRTERYSLAQYARPYFAKHVFAINSWSDPKPFLTQGIRAIQRVVRRKRARNRGQAPSLEPVPASAAPLPVPLVSTSAERQK